MPDTGPSETHSDWTFITVTFNSADTLREFWRQGAPAGARWIVVDNGSRDDTAAVANSLGAEVISLAENRGFSAANNVGFAQSATDYVCFVNPDVSVEPDGLAALSTLVDTTGGLVAPQLLNRDGSLQANGRGFPLLWSKVLHRLRPNSQHVATQYLRVAHDRKALAACWVMGAAVAGRKETFETLGAWDDWFFLYYEDKDLCLRAWSAGYPVHVAGSVRWQHGWARDTTNFHWAPWKRELASMAKFYSRYPEFLVGRWAARRRYGPVAVALSQE